jgi:DNA-binding CsgD family transcriptional regulator
MSRRPSVTRLAPREQQTLDLLLAGLPAKQIADRLGISVHTATHYTKAIFRHFGVGSRVALLALLLEAGRDDPSPLGGPISLAPRERQTLEVLLAGLSARQIADHLGISVHTAAHYTKVIFRRFGVGSRAALLALLLRRGLSASPILGT